VSLLKVKKPGFNQNKLRCGISKQPQMLFEQNIVNNNNPFFFIHPNKSATKTLVVCFILFLTQSRNFRRAQIRILMWPVNLSPNFSNLPNSRPNLSEIFVGYVIAVGVLLKPRHEGHPTVAPLSPETTSVKCARSSARSGL